MIIRDYANRGRFQKNTQSCAKLGEVYGKNILIIQMELKIVAKVLQILHMDILGNILNKRLIDYLEREYVNY